MNVRLRLDFRILLVGMVFLLGGRSTLAAPAAETLPSPVVTVGDQQLYTIQTGIGPFSATARAEAASARITALMQDVHQSPNCIHAVASTYASDIACADLVLTTVTDADAAAEGKPRAALVETDLALIRSAVIKVRREYSYRSLLLGGLYAVLTTIALIGVLISFRRLFPKVYARIRRWRGTHLRTIKIQSLELLTEERLMELLLQIAGTIRFVATVAVLYFYILLVFSFFPWTRGFGHSLFAYIVSPIAAGWASFVAYIPRLLVVIVIAFFTYLALRIARFVFREIERESITWPGFYPEWAKPTQKIVQLLLLAFSVVIVFPYLPGSDSPAFKGVSIFLGVLFSLGSSSAVSNVVAGVLLTYTRAFKVGDRVQIADSTGDVMEKGLLATQVRTIKNVLVTIPNSLVLSGQIVNYSQSLEGQPLILHTTVTIGYDSPWRQIHKLLTGAAARTEGVLSEPAPFVLQTSLDDFYVSYQVNAYTNEPSRMASVYSELFQNIQDEFNEAGVEIMSPHYGALRDGNATAIPASYLPSDYRQRPFVVAQDVPSGESSSPEGSGSSS